MPVPRHRLMGCHGRRLAEAETCTGMTRAGLIRANRDEVPARAGIQAFRSVWFACTFVTVTSGEGSFLLLQDTSWNVMEYLNPGLAHDNQALHYPVLGRQTRFSDMSMAVAVLEPADSSREYLERILAGQGFPVFACRDADTLFQHIEYEDVDLVLVGEGVAIATVLDKVLPGLAANAVGTVVQAAGADADYRLALLRGGADLCLDRSYGPQELAALLLAQTRRWRMSRRHALIPVPDTQAPMPPVAVPATARDTPFSKPGDVWRVLYQGWVLLTPDGARINLTGLERACFSCLLNSPRRELSRESLREVAAGANRRSINVAISRLRRKIQGTGVRLPLHTVHGTGYVFVGDLASH